MKSETGLLGAVVFASCLLPVGCDNEPPKSNDYYRELVVKSDNFGSYELEFTQIARRLLEADVCTEEDLTYQGGWMRSPNYRPKPVYFTYCGDHGHVRGRLYFNADTLEYWGRAEGDITDLIRFE